MYYNIYIKGEETPDNLATALRLIAEQLDKLNSNPNLKDEIDGAEFFNNSAYVELYKSK